MHVLDYVRHERVSPFSFTTSKAWHLVCARDKAKTKSERKVRYSRERWKVSARSLRMPCCGSTSVDHVAYAGGQWKDENRWESFSQRRRTG